MSHDITLPGGIVAGYTLVVVTGVPNGGIVPAAGYSEFFSKNVGGNTRLQAFWRKATGSEGGTVVFTTGGNSRSAHSVLLINAADPTVSAPVGNSGSNGNNTQPDPDSLTPAGGSQDYLWLAICAVGEQNVLTGPAGFSNLNTIQSTAGRIAVASAELLETNTSKDPGVFQAGASSEWVAGTLAIYPGTVTPPPPSAGQKSQMLI